MAEHAVARGDEGRKQIGFEPGQDRLAFGVAETDVEFEKFRTILGDHQSGEEHAFEGVSFLAHAVHRRFDDLFHHPRDHLIRHHRRRGIGAHAARVRPGVAFAESLMILGRG